MRDHPKSNASGLRQSPSVCARVSAGAFAMKPWHESWRRVSVRQVAWVEFSATRGSRSLSIGAGLSRCRCEGSRGWPCVCVCGPIISSSASPSVGGMSAGSGANPVMPSPRAAMPLALCPSLIIPHRLLVAWPAEQAAAIVGLLSAYSRQTTHSLLKEPGNSADACRGGR